MPVLADDVPQRGPEQHAEAIAEVPRPARGDPERGPDRAADAVRGDQVAGPDRAAVAQRDRDALGTAPDAHDLDPALKPRGRQRAEVRLEHRLEVVLRRARRRDRAEDPLWARDGKPTSTACPEAAAASEVAAQARHSTSISPARTCRSSPQERSSSIDAVLMPVARGRSDGRFRRSTTSVSIPARASVIAAVSPAGPAPTTSTGTSSTSVSIVIFFRRTVRRTKP